MIRISGIETEAKRELAVEDNGVGMDDALLSSLRERLASSGSEGDGLGLRNVLQRLWLHFGEDAMLFVEPGSAGGIKVRLLWSRSEAEERGGSGVLDSDRG